MKLLPGFCATPDWPGPRCPHCGRGIGGDGTMMFDCKDAGMQCLTWERIPHDTVMRFCRDQAWANITLAIGQQGGTVLEAIEWFTTPRAGGASPLQMMRDGRGREVLEAQYEEFPVLARQLERIERARQATLVRERGAAASAQ